MQVSILTVTVSNDVCLKNKPPVTCNL